MKPVLAVFIGALVLAIVALWWFAANSGASNENDVKAESRTSPATETSAAPTDRGELRYGNCRLCHGNDGMGQVNKGPSIRGSLLTNGPPEPLIRAVLLGIAGGRHPDGTDYLEGMTPQAWLPDADLAALLSYVRRSWGNTGTAVTAEQVGKIRNELAVRRHRFTRAELGLP